MQTYEIESELQSLDSLIPTSLYELRLKYLDVYIKHRILEELGMLNQNVSDPLKEISRFTSTISGDLGVINNTLVSIQQIMKEHTEFFTHEKEGGDDIVGSLGHFNKESES